MHKKWILLRGKAGFTLLEVLLVVLVISVLAAVAVPQYRRAVAKSRYKSMFAMAKAAYTGQEHFYLGHGHYAQDLSSLDISVPSNSTTADISVTLHNDDFSDYLLTTHKQLNNTLVIYNQHSAHYPNHVYCEAKAGDALAVWVCTKGLAGTEVESGSFTPGYVAYVLEGNSGVWEEISTAIHDPVAYTNDSGQSQDSPLVLQEGDTCTASKTNGCQYLDVNNAECTASGQNGCSNSQYSDESACSATANGGCANSSYTEESTCSTTKGKQGCADSTFTDGSTCAAGSQTERGTTAGCQRSTFVDSECYVYQNNAGNKSYDTACGGDDNGGYARYDHSTCYNMDHSNGYGCGVSEYTNGSKCYSSNAGGCGHSTFSGESYCYTTNQTGCQDSVFDNHSVCVGKVNNGCRNNLFTDGSVCMALAQGSCKTNNNYDSTSRCSGGVDDNGVYKNYCPVGSPKDPATNQTWRKCDKAHNDPEEQIQAGMSC